ncbi:uncharacterized protein si:ch211-243a20.4 isoform X2 [Scomber scombrus]|uniref:Uncharacterized protein si:ch211-243a20.4 isoform X2 n=1 Tax=Scomber scombrus TaxID=13677 RepID=A0AAV1N2G8_SCOSC
MEDTVQLENTVFVALKGEELSIKYNVTTPANQTEATMKCYNPNQEQIYEIPAGQLKWIDVLVLKNLTITGEYFCEYKTAKAYWFLRVRDEGYKEAIMWDYKEIITLTFFTSVLLIFSVVGSLYVFRGYWKEKITDSGKKQKQNQEERKEGELKEDQEDVTSSSSFYASLEPRPRSIYGVLDYSATETVPDQSKAAQKTEKTPETMMQTTEKKDEDVFESVYENF